MSRDFDANVRVHPLVCNCYSLRPNNHCHATASLLVTVAIVYNANWLKLKFHWDQFPCSFPVENVTGKSPNSYDEAGDFQTISTCQRWSGVSQTSSLLVANLLRGSWRRRQQVREEVTGKLVPVEFELYSGWPFSKPQIGLR